MAVADFKIQTSVQADRGYDAATSEAITLQLENTPSIDIFKVVFSVTAQSKDAPDLTLSPSSGQPATPTGTVTFTMPATGFHSYMIQCVVNDGKRSTDRGLVVDAGYTKKRLIAIRGAVTDLRKTVPRERDEYDAEGWSPALNELMEAQETGSVGGVDATEPILTNGAAPSISGAVDVTALGSTLALASTTVAPLAVRLNPSSRDTVLDVASLRRSTSSGSFGATGIGARVFVELEDGAGNIDTAATHTWDYLDATSASEDARYLVRLQVAGTLTDVWSMRGATMRVPGLGGSGAGFVAVNNDGDLSFALAASATALYLEDATSAVTTNGRPIRNLAAALDFNRANGLPVTAANTLATSGTKIPVFSFRRLTGGVGATNDGGYISFTIPDGASAETEAARLGWSWQNVTGTYGEVTLGVRNNLGLGSQYTFDSAGKLTTASLAATGLSAAGLVTNDASGNLATSATAVLCNGTVPANLTAGVNIQSFASALTFGLTNAADNNVQPVLYITRAVTGAPGVVNVGGQVVFTATDDAEDDAAEAGTILWRMTDVTNGAHAAELVLGAATGGSVVEVLAILGTGSAAFKSTLTPSITQTKRTGTGSNDGATLSVTAQAGQDVAAGTNNDGGAIEVASGAVGGGGTGGSAGDVILKTGSTPRLTLQGDGSDALFATSTTTHVVERSVPYNGGDATGAVTLDFSQSNKIEVSALVDDVTFTITGAVVGARYSVIVRQHASSAKTTTWASGLFASGDDAIGTTVNTYTAWQFEIMTGGTILCVGVKKDIVIP